MKKRQTHYKERGQLEERKSLGALEKKRHFLVRSEQEKEREEKIQKIKKLADQKNPEEFAFFMHRYKRKGIRLVKKNASQPSAINQDYSIADSIEEKKTLNTLPNRIVFID
ncbi:hypothetical protein NEFER03_1907 [Nematocida sp. LUAm3]|nr:hypothetical protein NEFER03_1907 [Nematocida sp. LUAm3]KAI5173942.1 hypothetical protein NEFER02_0409 [Nematocida sp. LUAm2]KAI5177313.1 hypothetical protein NEFER01_0588 [Nematocida sp. LUAm1]